MTTLNNFGYTGSRGFTGSRGQLGNSGASGPIGYTGSRGISVAGATGATGLTGFTGSVGATGPQGARGLTGSRGFIGATGPIGATGLTGSQGVQGSRGYTGSRGFTGSAGLRGVIGPQGMASWTPKTTDGLTIDTDKFSTFIKTSGIDKSWDQRIYSVEGYNRATCSASITVVNSQVFFGLNESPRTNNVIDYGFYFNAGRIKIQSRSTLLTTDFGTYNLDTVAQIVYEGDKVKFYINDAEVYYAERTSTGPLHLDAIFYDLNSGLTGLTFGPMGWMGATGPTGYTGSIGVGFDGSKGDPGKDGYTGSIGYTGSRGVSGFTGSEGERGPAGFVGSRGFVGSQGLGYTGSLGGIGLQGIPGVIGATGLLGYTGSQGPIGPIGPRGATGATGIRGRTGATGATGATGPRGLPGTNGIWGASGPSGPVGFTGSQGFTGSEGRVLGYGGLESTSANSISLGKKTFVTNQLGSQLLYLPGTFVEIRSNVYTTTNSMVGVIESFVGNTLEANILTVNGNASALTQWYINLTGSIGATGPRGASAWTPKTTSGITVNDNTDFSKTLGNLNVWNDRVYSIDGFEEVSCSAQAANFDYAVMFGITSNLSVSRPAEDIDYAFRFNVGYRGHLEIKTNSTITDLGFFNSLTTTQIICDNSTVKFYIDSELIQTTSKSDTDILHFDSAYYTVGSGLVNVSFSPLGKRGYSGSSAENLIFTGTNNKTNIYKNGNQINIDLANPLIAQVVAPQWDSVTTVSGTISPNWNNGGILLYRLSGDIVLNRPLNMPIGAVLTVILQQDLIGNRIMSASEWFKFADGRKTLTVKPFDVTMLEIFKLSENVYLTKLTNYQ